MLTTHRFYYAVLFSMVIATGVSLSLALILERYDNVTSRPRIDEVKLNASAAHGSDTFAVATGTIEGHVDGVFCLDFLTGDLTGLVLDPRRAKFVSAFKTNVVKDLPVEEGKMPKYVLALGKSDVAASVSNARIGSSIIYVIDCNSGRVCAYAFPWSTSVPKSNPNEVTVEPMIRLDIVKIGDLKLRQ